MNSLILLGVVVAVIGIVNGVSILVRKFRSSYVRHRPMYIELNPFLRKIRPNRRHLHDTERSKSPDSRATDGITDPPWEHEHHPARGRYEQGVLNIRTDPHNPSIS